MPSEAGSDQGMAIKEGAGEVHERGRVFSRTRGNLVVYCAHARIEYSRLDKLELSERNTACCQHW